MDAGAKKQREENNDNNYNISRDTHFIITITCNHLSFFTEICVTRNQRTNIQGNLTNAFKWVSPHGKKMKKKKI